MRNDEFCQLFNITLTDRLLSLRGWPPRFEVVRRHVEEDGKEWREVLFATGSCDTAMRIISRLNEEVTLQMGVNNGVDKDEIVDAVATRMRTRHQNWLRRIEAEQRHTQQGPNHQQADEDD